MTWLVTGIFIASTVYSADQQRQAGKQQRYNLERQAEQERFAAQNEELKRREKLNKALSANIQAAAAGGSVEGSSQAIALKGAEIVSGSEGAESLSERMRQDLLKREAKAAQKAGNVQATSTLLTGAYKASQLR